MRVLDHLCEIHSPNFLTQVLQFKETNPSFAENTDILDFYYTNLAYILTTTHMITEWKLGISPPI